MITCDHKWQGPYYIGPGEASNSIVVIHECYLPKGHSEPCICGFCSHPAGLEAEHITVDYQEE